MQPSAISRTIGLPVGILATLVLALAACTSSSPAASTGGEPSTATSESTAPGSSTAPASSTGTGSTAEACALATTDEVGTAYGFTVAIADPNPPADTNYSYCTYAQAGDTPANVLTYVSLSEAALAIYEGYKAQADETVSGVGDEAFWADDVLYVKKGSAFASIQAVPSRPGSVDPHEAAVALGKIIAGNM
jgi:hypothetical protein